LFRWENFYYRKKEPFCEKKDFFCKRINSNQNSIY
jgi:hypothetical protein